MKRIIFVLCMMVGFWTSSTLSMNTWNGGGWAPFNPVEMSGPVLRPFIQDDQMLCPIEGEMKQAHELTRLECWHRNCTDCLRDRVEQAIQDRNIVQLRCPEGGCNHGLTEQEVRGLGQEIFERYRALQAELRDAEARARAEGLSFEKRKMIWNGSNMQACPNCFRLIQKNSGCNHMTCRREVGGCGHEFCWLCLEPWRGFGPCNPVLVAKAQLKRVHPGYTAIKLIVLAGASYGAYKLYKYFYPPQEEALQPKEESGSAQPIEAQPAAQNVPVKTVTPKIVKKQSKRGAHKKRHTRKVK